MTKIFKKSLAFVIALALLVSCLIIPGMVGAVADELDIWDGTFVKPVDVDDDGYFEIFTPEELAWIVKNNGRQGEGDNDPAAKIELMNDIWLNDMLVTVIDGVPSATKATDTSVVIDLNDDENNGLNEWFDGWTNRFYVGSEFKGNGHVVNGLYLKTTANREASGLIPRIGDDLTVTDLGVENAYINADGNTEWDGLIIGSVHWAKATVQRCYTGASTYMKNNRRAGAIVGGGQYDANVYDSYSLTTLDVEAGGGAIVGDAWGHAYVTRCYAYNYDVNRPDTDTVNTHDSYKFTSAPGASVKNNADIRLGDAYLATDGFPVLKAFCDDVPTGWNGIFQSTTPDSDEDGYAEISNASQLMFATIPGTYGINVELTNDIVVNDIDVVITDGVAKICDANGAEVTDFYGLAQWHTAQNISSEIKFEGNGHTVRGIFSTYTFESGDNNNQGIALYNMAEKTDVSNLRLEDMYLKVTGGTAAGIVANVWNCDLNHVDSCLIGETCYIEGDHASGVFGCGAQDNKIATVSNSAILATIKANGGSRGAVSGNIWACGQWNVSNTYATINIYGGEWGQRSTSYENVGADVKGSDAPSKLGDLRNFAVTTSYPVPVAFKENPDIWGGFLSNGANRGTGNPDDPYIITNGEELAWVIHNSEAGKYYKLANDIYLNDVSKINWDTADVAEGYAVRNWYDDLTVQGNFEGDGHVVYGLYKNRDYLTWWGSSATALFPRVALNTNLDIHGIGVDCSFIVGQNAGSAFVGTGENSDETTSYANVTIDECFVGENTVIKGYDAGAAIGINRGIKATVTNFYTLATLSAQAETGIVADTWGVAATMDKVYNANGSIDTKNNQGDTTSNAYATAAGSNAMVMDKESMMGETALDNMSGLSTDIWYALTEGCPSLKIRGNAIADINRDGDFDLATDGGILRVAILDNVAVVMFGDRNNDAKINICDLVALYK